MLYNTDTQLWADFRNSRLEQGRLAAPVTVHDGMICGTHYVLARFSTSSAAEKCLRSAGYVKRDKAWHLI